MQPRLAALLFALGLVDLAYVNLGPGREVFADAAVQPGEERSANPSPQPGLDEPGLDETRPEERRAPEERPGPDARLAPPAPAGASVEATPPTPPLEPAPSAPAPANDLPAPELGSTQTGAAAAVAGPSLDPDPAALAEPASELPASDLTVGFPEKAASALTPRAREALTVLAARLRAHPDYRVRITGHADARGSREFNKDLGARRARAVSEILLRAGVPREQIDTESRGEDQPKAGGASERAWAANRRVEITIGSERSEGP
jgi:outer membrane protein OmpA-like peptidoglycan-associated protein